LIQKEKDDAKAIAEVDAMLNPGAKDDKSKVSSSQP